MHRRKIFWQLFPSYLIMVSASILLITLYIILLFKGVFQEQALMQTKVHADTLQMFIAEAEIHKILPKALFAGVLIAFISAIVIYKVSRGISYPLERGNKEQEAVLANMKEGIIAFDMNENILKINKSAAEMLNIESINIDNSKLKEVITDKDFLNFIEEALISNKTLEDGIGLLNSRDKFIQIYSSPICNQKNVRTGTLIVLNDITKIKRLENVRRDFVANVSHELRTPITSIKGFVETLLDGDLTDIYEVKSFLDIVLKHVNRLNAIIEDLLSISRLEQGQEKAALPVLETCKLKDILKSALQVSDIKAKPKQIKINISCNDNIEATVNSSLLEQAVINLVDNAINYSNEKTLIDVIAEQTPDQVIIKVKDQGCGIPKEHLPRIFERFYRVDKARSRKQGETGLGLAIVKHIIQTHGGQIDVQSEVGVGSCFTISLPQK